MRKQTLRMLIVVMTVVISIFTGCVSLETISAGESLASLTKITETPDAGSPFGGDDDGTLFFNYQVRVGQCNIYKKDKPLSNSMTQVTSVDFAINPTYNKIIDKIAFRMNNDIYVMPATKGKGLTQITNTNNCVEDHPCFTQDGKYLLYDRIMGVSNGNYYYILPKNSEIWIKNMETGENTLLGGGWTPSFSPDGKKIVYCKVENYKSSIWIMDIDGENQTKITDNNTLSSAQRPRFSPDGNYIVFDAVDKKGNMDLYVVSVDGGNLTRLTLNKSNDTQPYWSSDGYIYFVSDRGGKINDYNIWRFKY